MRNRAGLDPTIAGHRKQDDFSRQIRLTDHGHQLQRESGEFQPSISSLARPNTNSYRSAKYCPDFRGLWRVKSALKESFLPF
jgi:hypothetical protein